MEILLIPIIIGILGIGAINAEPKQNMTKRGQFCTVYKTKDGGNTIRECYEVRNTR